MNCKLSRQSKLEALQYSLFPPPYTHTFLFPNPYATAVLHHNPSIQASVNVVTDERLVCNVAEASRRPATIVPP